MMVNLIDWPYFYFIRKSVMDLTISLDKAISLFISGTMSMEKKVVIFFVKLSV